MMRPRDKDDNDDDEYERGESCPSFHSRFLSNGNDEEEEVGGGKLNKKGEGGKLPLETRAGWEEETGQRRRDRGAAQLTLHNQTPEKFNCM